MAVILGTPTSVNATKPSPGCSPPNVSLYGPKINDILQKSLTPISMSGPMIVVLSKNNYTIQILVTLDNNFSRDIYLFSTTFSIHILCGTK